MRPWLIGAGLVVGGLLSTAAAAADEAAPTRPRAESGELSREEASRLVEEMLAAIDRDGLLPADRTAFSATRASLRAVLTGTNTDVGTEAQGDGDHSRLSRAALYAAARRHLKTLDADGHSLLWSREQMAGWQRSTRPQDAASASTIERWTTPDGVVLVFRPAPATFIDPAAQSAYARAAALELQKADHAPRPCALVINLDDQTGGNAWPVIEALHDLFTPGNTARFVDARDARRPIVARWPYAHVPTLARFAGSPVGLVISERTASAGEMLAMMLLGESRVRSFGQATHGATTANVVLSLPDQASLMLSVARYALGDAPPLRGPILPAEPVAVSEHQRDAVDLAARWAASQSAACRKGSKGARPPVAQRAG